SPWRSWRNDEPSLEQLLMHPEPWDAEARLQQESSAHRAGSPQNAANTSGALGRPNPYAARTSAESRAASADQADSRSAQASQAEFEAAYAAAPPHLRGLLKRQWEATQALNGRQLNEPLSDKGSDADEEAEGGRFDQEKIAAARNLTASSKVPQSKTPPIKSAQLDAPRSSRPAASDDPYDAAYDESGDGTVTYSLSDRDEEGSAPLQRRARPEDLTPPPVKEPARQIAHAEPIDTGAGDDVLVKPLATPRKRDSQKADTAAGKSPAKKPADQSSASYVATASAEAKADSAAASPVARAVAEEAVAEEAIAESDEMGWRDHLREALRELEEEPETAAESPAEKLHRQATSRMLRLALGELDSALQPIEGLQTHEQEFFRQDFQALHDAIDPKGNPVLARRWTLALDSHRKAMSHLAAVSNLEIKNASFCTDVHSYGVVSKFPNPHFKPNQELLLYCELDNFSAEPAKDGYETQLQGSYEIVNASGVRVADMLLPEDADICRNPRRDYFIAYRIYMPQKIEPGRYQLRLTIEDMKGRKFGQTSLDFQIVQ
ncbi:MAG: hypothetical protein ACTHK7_01950, partial [Aureliella sp.]